MGGHEANSAQANVLLLCLCWHLHNGYSAEVCLMEDGRVLHVVACVNLRRI